MSGSGTGRGRGWLNLNKNAGAPKPGGLPNGISTNNTFSESKLVHDQSSATIGNSQYQSLVCLLEQLDLNDDGILLNQKLKHIIESWGIECNSDTDVIESFKYIYNKCLQDSMLATKVVSMISSYSFITKEVHNIKIRKIFITCIQYDFENCKQLQTKNPIGFRNSVRMLGEFYHKARLADGRVINFLAAPLVKYLMMLLDTAEPADLELFTSQFYINGNAIKIECSQKMNEILTQVRQVLSNNVKLTPLCRTWLLLAIDVAHNRFGLLPAELQRFYQEQLGDKAMANFQGTHSALSIETGHSYKSLDGYQSNVSVLQVTPPESTSPVNENPMSSETLPQSFNNTQTYSTQNYNSDSVELGANANNREKVGRPILGAGARLQRHRASEDSNSCKMKSKENSSNWDNKHKMSGKPWGNEPKKGQGVKNNKGWEHDDRFETEYY